MKILVTCPPMIKSKNDYNHLFEEKNIHVHYPKIIQTMSEKELLNIIGEYDGWIIGDDPATEGVLKVGSKGKLKAVVKWGIGTDNIDFDACDKFKIKFTNTPGMFGNEVADLALHYLIGLARDTYFIDRSIRDGKWPKNTGISLSKKKVGLIGYGDIGNNLALKLEALDMSVIVYDPGINLESKEKVIQEKWPNLIEKCDFLVFTCSLNNSNFHMFNSEVINKCKKGVRVVNVARGGLINELDLIDALKNDHIHSCALDVYENEPIPKKTYLKDHPYCILGSHNASNTFDAVSKTNKEAVTKLFNFLEI